MSSHQSQDNNSTVVLGLDVGSKKIGVARGNTITKLAEPIALVSVDGHEIEVIESLVSQHQADVVVVGLPRGLDGQETDQTKASRHFADRLRASGLRVELIDEAGTTVAAKDFLSQRYRPHWPHESVDAVAAMLLLNDYLEAQ